MQNVLIFTDVMVVVVILATHTILVTRNVKVRLVQFISAKSMTHLIWKLLCFMQHYRSTSQQKSFSLEIKLFE